MQIFLTGISGLLGTNLAMDLLNEGYSVKGLVRNKSSYVGPQHQHLELIVGELFDDYRQDLKSCECVIHVAALTSPDVLDYSLFKRTNVDATLRIAENCLECGVKNFIFVSTASTIGFGTKDNPGREGDPMPPYLKNAHYIRSKFEAEKSLKDYKDRLNISIVHPTFMIGAYDSKPSSGKLVLLGLDKLITFYPSGGKNFVHVKDVSKGIISILKNNAFGKQYLFANENLTYKKFFKQLNVVAGQKTILVKAPDSLLKITGHLGHWMRSIGIKVSSNKIHHDILMLKTYYTNVKSVEELNLTYRPVSEAIHEAIAYFRKEKKN
ncbi:NAD-dependent epimerase/dehydratase family protein [Aegicerativicinus sediminis]